MKVNCTEVFVLKAKAPRIPSLQHFSVLLGGDSSRIERKLLGLLGLPPVSYMQFREKWVVDLIRLGVPVSSVARACLLLKGELNQRSNLEALSAFEGYLSSYLPVQIYLMEKRYFPIGRGLQVPVNPPGVVVDKDGPKLFWPSFWKRDKFDPLTRAVFGTILDRTIFRLSDYREMPLAFVDLSAVDGDAVRSMTVLGRSDFEVLTDAELRVETDKFVTAYLKVKAEAEATTQGERRAPASPLFLDHPRA